MASDVHPHDGADDMTGGDTNNAETNTNIEIHATHEVDDPEHELTTNSVSSSDTNSSDSDDYMYQDGFYKARTARVKPTPEHYEALYEEASRQLEVQKTRFRNHTGSLNSKYEKEGEEHRILQERLAALNKEIKADLEVMKINLHNALAEKRRNNYFTT